MANANGDQGSVQTRQRSASYPRYTLEQCEELTRAAFHAGARNLDQDRIAQEVGYKNARNGSFRGFRATAGQFGMITYEGDNYLSVAQQWIDVLDSEDTEALQRARQEAIVKPPLFRQLIDEYVDKHLPSMDKIARRIHLNPKYGILQDAAEVAARIFIESAKYAGMVDAKGFLRAPNSDQTSLGNEGAQRSFYNDALGQTGRSNVNEQPPHIPSQSHAQQKGVSEDVGGIANQASLVPKDLLRQEVPLRKGRMAIFFVPRFLTLDDKRRLKGYIDLMLDEEEEPLQLPPANREIDDSEEEEVD